MTTKKRKIERCDQTICCNEHSELVCGAENENGLPSFKLLVDRQYSCPHCHANADKQLFACFKTWIVICGERVRFCYIESICKQCRQTNSMRPTRDVVCGMCAEEFRFNLPSSSFIDGNWECNRWP